ncbi:hypothetical protein FJZ19_00795 [Candidatus Pacearchaeota archaeon]|nr:hypothetical protein [Candidatus Pacearchaeota archaeon]
MNKIMLASFIIFLFSLAFVLALNTKTDANSNTNTNQNQKIIEIARFSVTAFQNQKYNPKKSWWSISGGDAVIEFVNYTVGNNADEKKTPGAYYGDVLARNLNKFLFLKDKNANSGSSISFTLLSLNNQMKYKCKSMQLYYPDNSDNQDKKLSWTLIGKRDMSKFIFVFYSQEDNKAREFNLIDCFPTNYTPSQMSPSSYDNLKNLTSLVTHIEIA